MSDTPAEVTKSSTFTDIIRWYTSQYASASSHTAKAKKLDLEKFHSFLKVREKGEPTLGSFTHSSVTQFLEYLFSAGESPATVSRRLATIKHFGRIISDTFPGSINPAKSVKAPKIQQPKPKALNLPEIVDIISDSQSEKEFRAVRDRAIFIIFLETGLRADEVRLLRMNQLDDSLEWIRRVRTKAKHFRDVYLSSRGKGELVKYLEFRRSELEKRFPNFTTHKDKAFPIFVSFYKADYAQPDTLLMSPKSIWRVVNKLGKAYKAHPHLLRHTFATRLLDSCKDIRLVSQALGHSDIRITMRYTERLDEEVAEAIEKSDLNKI